MCKVKVFETAPGHLDSVCEASGKRVAFSNEYGMFCEDFCGLEESKENKANLDAFLMKMIRNDMGLNEL